MFPSGEETMLTKRRRLRDEEVLVDRDLDFLVKLRQGRKKRDIAFAYRISVRHLNDRLQDIPPDLKAAVNAMVDRYTADDFPFIPDVALDRYRRAMKRNDRVEKHVGSAQAG